ncbi:YidC/Oxa1 family membrane protein insertase [Chloroflexota bacterium]
MNAWELIIQQPVINILIMLTQYLGGSFGLAIIALTIGVNVIILPLNLKQMRATRAMQEIQPRVAELQKKYAKDKQKLSQEQMKLYKESGMNPAGCLLPMLIQMPIWIALYQSVMLSLAVAPEGLLNLSRYLYSWPELYLILPLSRDFMWGLLDLAEPNVVLAILVGATMWLQQKMATPVSADPKQAAQSRMMLWMMPMMFTFLALSFPSGLALFWVTSSIVRIAMQYYVTGWGALVPTSTGDTTDRDKKYKKLIGRAEGKSSPDVGADIVIRDDEREQTAGDTGDQAPGSARYQSGRDRSRHRKK